MSQNRYFVLDLFLILASKHSLKWYSDQHKNDFLLIYVILLQLYCNVGKYGKIYFLKCY